MTNIPLCGIRWYTLNMRVDVGLLSDRGGSALRIDSWISRRCLWYTSVALSTEVSGSLVTDGKIWVRAASLGNPLLVTVMSRFDESVRPHAFPDVEALSLA